MCVGILINPRAKKNRGRADMLGRLEAVVRHRGLVALPQNSEELMETLRQFRQASVGILALSGGDGTIGLTLKAVEEVWRNERSPALSLLRGGTMNTVANAICMPRGSQVLLLKRLLRALTERHGLHETSRACLRVGDRPGFLFGTGFGRRFLEEYYSLGHASPTVWTALRTVLRLGSSAFVAGERARKILTSETYTIAVDDMIWPSRPYAAVLAGTVDQLGLGFRVFHRIDAQSEGFHVLAIHGSAREIAARLPAVRLGRSLGVHLAYEALARRAALHTSEETVSYFLDGDILERQSPLTIELGGRVRFVWGH